MVFSYDQVSKEQKERFKVDDFRPIAVTVLRKCAVCGRVKRTRSLLISDPSFGLCEQCGQILGQNDLRSLRSDAPVLIGQTCEFCTNGSHQATQKIFIGGRERFICASCLGIFFTMLN